MKAYLLLASLAVWGGSGCAPATPPAAESATAPAAPTAPAPVGAASTPPAVTGGVLTPATYVADYQNAPHLLVDVRTPAEFASGHLAGAVNIPLQELNQRLGELPTDQPVVLYCRTGNRSNQARRLLEGAGYTGIYDLGGIQAWQAAGYPVE